MAYKIKDLRWVNKEIKYEMEPEGAPTLKETHTCSIPVLQMNVGGPGVDEWINVPGMDLTDLLGLSPAILEDLSAS